MERPADPVPREAWYEAGTLVLTIATTSLFNRLNVTTRQDGRRGVSC